jgi:4-hydroxybenzoate polyprenyltransferase
MQYLKLIRFPNLVIIALLQYLIKFSLIIPFGFEVVLTNFEFGLLVLSTVLIAAGGYAINDYFDVQVDKINNSDEVIVGKTVKRRVAMAMHLCLSGIGVVIGFYLGYKAGNVNFGLIHVIASGLLWFYSTNYKKQFLTGNLVVSFLTALVVIMIPIFEITPSITEANAQISKNVFLLIGIYAVFAFITTLIREIIKDLEDYKGDVSMGYKTLAISWGPQKAKSLLNILGWLTLVSIALLLLVQFGVDYYAFTYVLLFIEIPLLMLLVKLPKAENALQYHKLSNLMKIIMIFGCLSMFVFTILAQYGL